MSGFAEAEEEEEWRLVEVVKEEEAQRRRPCMSLALCFSPDNCLVEM